MARLQALRPGLDINLDTNCLGNPRLEQLASHVAGLFVLAPAARAAQRQAVLRSAQTDILGWEEAARQLQATLPTLVALEPTLPAAILGWREQQQRLARRREGRGTASPPRTPRPAPAAPAPTPPGAGNRAIGGVAAIAILVAIRVFAGLGSPRSSTPEPIRPQDVRFPAPAPNVKFQPADADDAERMRKAFENWEAMQREIDRAAKDLEKRDKQRRAREGDAPGRPDPQQP